MPGRARRGRVFALLSAAALAVLVGSPGIAAANDGRPQVNPEERAAAMIRPAVMYLAGQGYGQVRLPNGQILSQFGPGSNMPFIATWACTGFVINPDGWVATAGHCVDPESAKLLILKRAAKEYIAQFPDAPESRDPAATLEWLQKNARVEGDTADRGPEISLTLMYGTGTNVAGKIPANVVDFRPLGKGDVAASEGGKAQPAVVGAGYRRRCQHRHIGSRGGFLAEHRERHRSFAGPDEQERQGQQKVDHGICFRV